MEQGLKKTLKLPQLIALAAGGMIAAWMVEIQYWFSLTVQYLCYHYVLFMQR